MNKSCEYDIVVAGGGTAGLAAAVAAARCGVRTLLVERYGFLGGLATTALVGAFCGLYTTGPQKKQVVHGLVDELMHRLRQLDGLTEKRVSQIDSRLAAVSYDPELFKFAAEQMALESGVDLLFHTFIADVIWDQPGSRLGGVVVVNKSGQQSLKASIIIDATGDADVAALAGVPFEYGDGQGGGQAMTTVFKLGNVESGRKTEEAIQEMRCYLAAAKESGRYRFERIDPVVFPSLPPGTISVNLVSVRGLNATSARDLTAAEIEGRRQVLEYYRAIRDWVPGFGQARLIAVAPQIGVRETRRILGQYVLTEEDVIGGAKFEDGITLGAWPVEIHDPKTAQIRWQYLAKEDDYYSIPFRCLCPQDIDNLLVVGRCASTSHVAHASTRVIAQAMGMGEAAGVAAGLALASGLNPTMVPITKLRAELIERGAVLELT
ncbi:MAG: FAD-dependent oxidoreductase [Thermoleophilia bacterium]|nr:FAD-dependent oxidoreductase [Thermoleophilia bacterium]